MIGQARRVLPVALRLNGSCKARARRSIAGGASANPIWLWCEGKVWASHAENPVGNLVGNWWKPEGKPRAIVWCDFTMFWVIRALTPVVPGGIRRASIHKVPF